MLTWLYANSQQQPRLSVQSFEYIWQKDVNNGLGKQQVIIPSGDKAKRSIEKSFANAVHERWNIDVPSISLSVKPLGILSNHPKFNTKLKDKQTGTWYLFLQIFDKGNSLIYYNGDGSLATRLELKCRLVSGFNDSVILDRTLLIKMNKEKAPPDQLVLEKLPAYPSSFIKAFDSIATWLFQPEAVNEKDLWLKPACVFTEAKTGKEPVAQLTFESDDKSIHLIPQPSFSFHRSDPVYKKIDAKKNAGGNTASGVLTLFTGISVNKARAFEYKADFSYNENDSTYHCVINYAEKETAEREREKVKNTDGSKSYSLKSGAYILTERRTDSNLSNVIMLGDDTLATFGITYISAANELNSYNRFWDGSDSTTIITLPEEWNNGKADDNVRVSGKLEGTPFFMRTSKQNIAKEFYLNNQLVLIIYGKGAPAKAILFQLLPVRQLKLITIFSSLPYPYFNYSLY